MNSKLLISETGNGTKLAKTLLSYKSKFEINGALNAALRSLPLRRELSDGSARYAVTKCRTLSDI
jgi:hypothetical protein